MEQDWTPVVLRKSDIRPTVPPPRPPGQKKFQKLDGDDPDPPKKPSTDLRTKVIQGRQRHSLTQRDLALKVGVKEGVIRDLESGKTLPETAVLVKIRTALGITK